MRFRALPVNEGNCFLFDYQNRFVLVDGGKNKTDIIKLLEQENIPNNHLDVLICTHYDADHINGILGIIESKKYTFKEIWLPEILGSISYTISNSKGLKDKLDYFRSLEAIELEDQAKIDSSTELPSSEQEKNSFQEKDLIFLEKLINSFNDSSLSFCSNINLKDDSIVTAPHHGSEENKQAYSVINGTKLYFVRSDKCQSKRPGNTYCKQSNRYCTICRNQAKNSKQKVELNYQSGLLTTLAPPCICC